MGVEARVTERQSENGTLYRVRVGPFSQLDAMNNVRGKLSDNGVDAAVVRISK
jgi:cell division protein FtsN